MDYLPVKVEGCNVSDNKFKDGKKVWLVTSLIERSKGLPVFEIPRGKGFAGGS